MKLSNYQQETLEEIKSLVNEARELDYPEWLGTQYPSCDKNSFRFNVERFANWLEDEASQQEWAEAKAGTVWTYCIDPKALKALEAAGEIKIEKLETDAGKVTLLGK